MPVISSSSSYSSALFPPSSTRTTASWVMLGVVASAWLVLPAIGHAQESRPRNTSATAITRDNSASAPIATLLPAGLDATTRAALVPIFQRAREQGLPLELLSDKAAEGMLHNAPSARIVSAVTAFKERVAIAKAALAPAELAEIGAGAEALSGGVSPNVLRDIRHCRPKTTVAVPLGVLAQLVARGIPASRASDIVLRLLERGASTEQLASLPGAIEKDVADGRPALYALDARAANVLSTLGPRPLTTPGGAASITAAAVKSPH